MPLKAQLVITTSGFFIFGNESTSWPFGKNVNALDRNRDFFFFFFLENMKNINLRFSPAFRAINAVPHFKSISHWKCAYKLTSSEHQLFSVTYCTFTMCICVFQWHLVPVYRRVIVTVVHGSHMLSLICKCRIHINMHFLKYTTGCLHACICVQTACVLAQRNSGVLPTLHVMCLFTS